MPAITTPVSNHSRSWLVRAGSVTELFTLLVVEHVRARPYEWFGQFEADQGKETKQQVATKAGLGNLDANRGAEYFADHDDPKEKGQGKGCKKIPLQEFVYETCFYWHGFSSWHHIR